MDKLWIDDIRTPPQGWIWAKTSSEAIKLLLTRTFSEISFDHDLGGQDTAYRVACFLEEKAQAGKIGKIAWKIHSANPVGERNIRMAMESADKFWNQMK